MALVAIIAHLALCAPTGTEVAVATVPEIASPARSSRSVSPTSKVAQSSHGEAAVVPPVPDTPLVHKRDGIPAPLAEFYGHLEDTVLKDDTLGATAVVRNTLQCAIRPGLNGNTEFLLKSDHWAKHKALLEIPASAGQDLDNFLKQSNCHAYLKKAGRFDWDTKTQRGMQVYSWEPNERSKVDFMGCLRQYLVFVEAPETLCDEHSVARVSRYDPEWPVKNLGDP